MIVVESGARWPPPIMVPPRREEETLVIGQRPGESPKDLARRVLRTARGFAQLGQQLGHAVIVVEPGLCDESMTARHVIARTLIAGMRSPAGNGGLDLIVDGESDGELREAIMHLADLLVLSSGTASRPVRVRFGPRLADPTIRESGIHLRVADTVDTEARSVTGS